MSAEMWQHPAVLRNLERIKADGAHILPAGAGYGAATGKVQRTSVCPYREMWPILQSLARQRRAPEEGGAEAGKQDLDKASSP